MKLTRRLAVMTALALSFALPVQAAPTVARTALAGSSIAFTTAPPTSVLAGKTFTVAGKINPAKSRMTIIQEKVGSKWLAMGRIQSDSTGAFSIAVRFTKAGVHTLRAYSPANSQFGAATSETLAVATLAKYWLKDTSEARRFNGVTYAHTYAWRLNSANGSDSTDWDLQRKCTSLKMSLGILDSSPSGSAGKFEIYVDDSMEYSVTLEYGQDDLATIDVTNGLRLRIDVTRTSYADWSTPYMGMVIGDPQITCMPLA